MDAFNPILNSAQKIYCIIINVLKLWMMGPESHSGEKTLNPPTNAAAVSSSSSPVHTGFLSNCMSEGLQQGVRENF